MPAKLSTTLNKLDSVSECNRALLREFYENWQSKGVRSKRHINNLLTLAISFDKFFGGKPFTEINAKQQITSFLDHRYIIEHDRWVKREHDAEGRYISSYNQYLGLLRIFSSLKDCQLHFMHSMYTLDIARSNQAYQDVD
jgi:hypothetical protein